jgi:ribonuclease VapC
MIVDSSALVAILRREPERQAFSQALKDSSKNRISAASYFETSIVIDSARDPIASRTLDDLIEIFKVEIEPFAAEQAQIARHAYRDYGKGSGHPAQLNFGDCFSYALARAKREPLLYKGDDFIHTDVRSAI